MTDLTGQQPEQRCQLGPHAGPHEPDRFVDPDA
jgi:hypothetical protein